MVGSKPIEFYFSLLQDTLNRFKEVIQGTAQGFPKVVCTCGFFIFIFIYLATLDLSCSMWDLSSLIRDQTWAPCIGNAES